MIYIERERERGTERGREGGRGREGEREKEREGGRVLLVFACLHACRVAGPWKPSLS